MVSISIFYGTKKLKSAIRSAVLTKIKKEKKRCILTAEVNKIPLHPNANWQTNWIHHLEVPGT